MCRRIARVSRKTPNQPIRVAENTQDIIQTKQLLHQSQTRRGTLIIVTARRTKYTPTGRQAGSQSWNPQMVHRRSAVSCSARLKPVVFRLIDWLTTKQNKTKHNPEFALCRRQRVLRAFFRILLRFCLSPCCCWNRTLYLPPRNSKCESYTCLWRPLVFAVQTRRVGLKTYTNRRTYITFISSDNICQPNCSAFTKWDTQQCNRTHRKWNWITESSSNRVSRTDRICLGPGSVPVMR